MMIQFFSKKKNACKQKGYFGLGLRTGLIFQTKPVLGLAKACAMEKLIAFRFFHIWGDCQARL